jgi:hypothetical protein
MQLLKQNWKKIRNVNPCLACGESHETSRCIKRNGNKREFPAIEPRHQFIELPEVRRVVSFPLKSFAGRETIPSSHF